MRGTLFPGMDGTGHLFDPLRAELNRRQIDSVALRYPIDGPQDAASIAARLPDPRGDVLVAESFGGAVAMHIAARTKPAAILFINSFAHPPVGGASLLRGLIGAAPAVPPRWAIRYFMLGDADDALVGDVQAAIVEVPAAVLRDRARALLSDDHRSVLAGLDVPTAQLISRGDRLVASGRSGLDHVATTTLAGPHLLAQRHPEDVAEQIVRFCESIAKRVS